MTYAFSHWGIFSFSVLGSSPDRGQSPVEWGEIPSVHPSVHTSPQGLSQAQGGPSQAPGDPIQAQGDPSQAL